MRRKNTNVLLVFGVVIAIILLMIWLFFGDNIGTGGKSRDRSDDRRTKISDKVGYKKEGCVVNSFYDAAINILDESLCAYTNLPKNTLKSVNLGKFLYLEMTWSSAPFYVE